MTLRSPILLCAALLSTGVACAPAEPPPPPPPPDFAKVRLLAAVSGATRGDAFVHGTQLVPVTLATATSPGISPFRPVQVGDARATVLEAQSSKGGAERSITKDALYTVLETGDAADETRGVTWLEETFPAPVEGRAHVRFLRATAQGEGADVTFGDTLLALAPARDVPGDWRAIEPADPMPVLEVQTTEFLTARFSAFRPAAGDLLTLILVDGRPDSPPRLSVIRESRDPAVAATVDPLLEPDGVTKPKATVRLLHAAPDAGSLTAIAADQTTGPISVAAEAAFPSVSAWTEVVTDAAFKVTAGETTLLETALDLEEGLSYTLVFTPGSTAGTYLLLAWTTDRTATGARFGHALNGIPGTMELLDEATTTTLFGPTASGAAGAYVEAPADPVDLLVKANFGPNPLPPFARLGDVAFPADGPSTLALVGRIDIQTPANSVALALVLDDAESAVLQTIVPEVLAQQPPAP